VLRANPPSLPGCAVHATAVSRALPPPVASLGAAGMQGLGPEPEGDGCAAPRGPALSAGRGESDAFCSVAVTMALRTSSRENSSWNVLWNKAEAAPVFRARVLSRAIPYAHRSFTYRLTVRSQLLSDCFKNILRMKIGIANQSRGSRNAVSFQQGDSPARPEAPCPTGVSGLLPGQRAGGGGARRPGDRAGFCSASL